MAAVFENYFQLGHEETSSPFITPESRAWGANLTLKSAVLAAFILALSFTLSWFPAFEPVSYVLLITVYFLAGIPSLIESIEDLAAFDINIDILMTVAAFSSFLIGSGMEGALLLVLFALSGAMEDAVTSKAKGAISALHKLSPTRALVVTPEGTLIEKSLNDVPVKTMILIRSGQIVPLDGIVIEGISSVNLVHLTGENFPITKKVGDKVPAGARNLEGSLTLEVTHTSADSTLAKIIQLVTEAQESRPKLQRWFDKLSRSYAITIILLAALFAITFPYLLSIPFLGQGGSVYRALTFLIAASPCALIIAIPIAYLSAVSTCAKKGILLKGGITLDALASCTAVALDKTGTLTTGDLRCLGIEGMTGQDDLNLALFVAYAMEKNAVHPIAKAILTYGEKERISTISIKNFQTIPGYGLQAIAMFPSGEQEVYIGNPQYISNKLPKEIASSIEDRIKAIQERGELVAILLMGNTPYLFRFADTLRPKMKETLDYLKDTLNLRIVMLTGDHFANAQRIAKTVGLTDFYADLTPDQKLHHVTQLSQKERLAMVGDGINDAPALARANVGICMGKVGSTAAVDAADVVLLHDNIEYLGWLFQKAYLTQTIVKQNLILATSAIFAASIPALGGFIPLWLAVVLHEGGTVLVGLNALRLLRK